MFSPVQSTDRESLFTARIDLDVGVVGFGPWDIAAADLNGDGHIDLTTANKYSGSISVVLNKGGSFERVWNKVIGNSPTSLALADLDGDEDIDMAVSLNDYNPGGDTDYDLVSVLFNDGHGSFSERLDAQNNPVRYPVGNSPLSVFLADLGEDGNGDIDIVTANGPSNSISVLLNDGMGNFSLSINYSVGTNVRSVFLADLNGDGYNDAVTANRNDDSLSILFNNGNGTFQSPENLPVGDGPVDLYLENITGSPSKDIVVLNKFDRNVEVWENDGSGNFTFEGEYNIFSYNYTSLIVGDADQDGYNDILCSSLDDDLLTIFFYNNTNPATLSFDRTNRDVPGGPNSFVLADLEAGKPGSVNIATGNLESSTITILVSDVPPSISLLEPDGMDDFADSEFRIEWKDSDPDSDATIHLFYYPSHSPAQKRLIATFSEDDENDFYLWNVTSLEGGEYYIEAVISDDYSMERVTSNGPITVQRKAPLPRSSEIPLSLIVVSVVGSILTLLTLYIVLRRGKKPPDQVS